MRLRDLLPVIRENAKFLNANECRYAMKLVEFVKSNSKYCNSSRKYAELIIKKGLSDAKKELRFYYEILELAGVKVSTFEFKYFRNKAKSIKRKKPKKPKPFVDLQLYRRLLNSLEQKKLTAEKVAMVIMLASGKRLCDIKRLDSGSISWISENVFSVHIEKEKCNTLPKNYSVDLSDVPAGWCTEEEVEEAKKWLKSQGSGMQELSVAKLRQEAKFKLHSLRSVNCIHRVIAGESKEDIMAKIGWKSISSFDRYCKIDFFAIKKMASMDAVISKIKA